MKQIKAKYIDQNGFEYKSLRSKSSLPKRYTLKKEDMEKYTNKAQTFSDDALYFMMEGQNLFVRYNKSSGKLTVNEKIGRNFNKYGKTSSVAVKELFVDTIDFTFFKDLALKMDAV